MLTAAMMMEVANDNATRRDILAILEVVGDGCPRSYVPQRYGNHVRMEYPHTVYVAGPATDYTDGELLALAAFTARHDLHNVGMRRDRHGTYIRLAKMMEDDNHTLWWEGQRTDNTPVKFQTVGELLSYFDYPLVEPGWWAMQKDGVMREVTAVDSTHWHLTGPLRLPRRQLGREEKGIFPLVAEDLPTLQLYAALLAPKT